MRKNKLFITLFLIIPIILSTCIYCFYDNVTDAVSNKVPSSLVSELRYFLIYEKLENDPDYQFITFDDSIDEKLQQAIQEDFKNMLNHELSDLLADTNFSYKIKVNDKTVSNNYKKNDWTLTSGKLKIDKNGTFTSKNTLIDDEDMPLSDFSECLRLLNHYDEYAYDGDTLYVYYKDDNYAITNKMQINVPTDIELNFYIPYEIKGQNLYIYSYFLENTAYLPFVLIALLISICIMLIFILANNYEIEKNAIIFRSFYKLKAVFNLIIFAFMITLLTLGLICIVPITQCGLLDHVLNQYHIDTMITPLINIIIWTLDIYFCSVLFFLIKSIFKDGFLNWFHQKSLIYAIYKLIKNKIDKIDPFKATDKKIFKYVFIQMLIIIFMIITGEFGLFLAVVYSIWLFVNIKKLHDKYTKDYQTILHLTSEVANGNFNVVKPIDIGIYQELNDNLLKIKDNFKDAVKEKVASQNMKTELISNVSHDLKTPLTGIKNYIELLNDPNLDHDERLTYLQHLNHYVDRLSRLINDLFEVSKANSGNIELELNQLDIIELLQQITIEFKDQLEAKQLTIIENYPGHNIQCYLDGNKTYRVFENLYRNVEKYAMPNTRVYVDVKEIDDDVKITIKNISNAPINYDAKTITERFTRADSSRHEEGSGLGLAIVKSFVEIQDGKFDLELDGDLFKAIVIFKNTTLPQIPNVNEENTLSE